LKNYIHSLFFAFIVLFSSLSKADTTFQLNWASSGSASATGQITLDSTGIGDPVVEELRRRGLNINDEDVFKFTQNSRTNLLNNLAIMFENSKIKIPNDDGLINELRSFTIEMNEKGKAVIKCPDGLHDDRVMSLALAVWGVTERQVEDPMMMQRIVRRREQSNPWY
jgi:hypothetical protein